MCNASRGLTRAMQQTNLVNKCIINTFEQLHPVRACSVQYSVHKWLIEVHDTLCKASVTIRMQLIIIYLYIECAVIYICWLVEFAFMHREEIKRRRKKTTPNAHAYKQ